MYTYRDISTGVTEIFFVTHLKWETVSVTHLFHAEPVAPICWLRRLPSLVTTRWERSSFRDMCDAPTPTQTSLSTGWSTSLVGVTSSSLTSKALAATPTPSKENEIKPEATLTWTTEPQQVFWPQLIHQFRSDH